MKTKTQIENAIKWIEALLSGEYKQGRQCEMGDSKQGFCCWGLACHVVGRKFKSFDSWNYDLYDDIGFCNRSGSINPLFYRSNELMIVNDLTTAGFKRIGKYLIKHASTNFNPEVAKGIEKHFNK